MNDNNYLTPTDPKYQLEVGNNKSAHTINELTNWQKILLTYYLYPDSNMTVQFRKYRSRFPRHTWLNTWRAYAANLKSLQHKGWLIPQPEGRQILHKLSPEGEEIAESIARLNTVLEKART